MDVENHLPCEKFSAPAEAALCVSNGKKFLVKNCAESKGANKILAQSADKRLGLSGRIHERMQIL